MQGRGKRFNRFYKEAGLNPGVNTAISDWPPDMAQNGLQGDADKNIHGRNQQYVKDLLPDVRRHEFWKKRKLSRGDLVKGRNPNW